MTFKVLVLGTGMYFAIKWHYDQGKKGKDRQAVLRAGGKIAALRAVAPSAGSLHLCPCQDTGVGLNLSTMAMIGRRSKGTCPAGIRDEHHVAQVT